MSAFTMESKKKYNTPGNYPVYITEYMIYMNNSDQTRFILTKVKNNSDKVITETEFEISQFNGKGESIRKADYVFQNLEIKTEEMVIPLEKIKIDDSCDSIKVKLIQAYSNGERWRDGTWKEAKDEEITSQEQRLESPSVEESIQETNIVELKSSRFTFPFFITAIVSALCIISIVVLF